MRCLSVIVHHRGNEILTRCLDSLLANQTEDDRIIVFANGLEEELPNACDDPHIMTGESEVGLGFSEANNRAVTLAIEEFGEFETYLFINNDAVLHPGAMNTLKQHLVDHPDCAIVGPKLIIEHAPDHLNSLGINVTRHAEAWDEGIGIDTDAYGTLPSTKEVLAVTGAALMMRSSDFAQIGGWSQVYGYYFEDIDLCIRAWRARRTVRLEPGAVASHSISASSAPVSAFKTLHSWRNQFVLLLLHWPLTLLASVLPVLLAKQIVTYQKRRRVGAIEDAQLQARAWKEAIRLLPSIAKRRYSGGIRSSWTRFLVEGGSVPPIVVPEVPQATNSDEAPQMSRVLVCGLCPLPFENTPRNYGPGIRTWQFAKGLADAGHEVHVLAMMIDNSYESDPEFTEERDGVHIERVDYASLMDPNIVSAKIADVDPHALVGATIYGSFAIAQTEPELPFWADQFGHVMAEAQAKAALEQDNWPVAHFWPMAEKVGQWCDRLSTVSERQRYAAIGELGVLGRLNAEASGYDFTASIPCAVAPERIAEERPKADGTIRGSLVPESAFVVLWSGGYNVWSDVETIFHAVDGAMARREEIHFVSTGAGIDGHDLDTYSRFQELVETSKHRDRFHLMGWVLGDLVPKIVAESDLGILAERPIYEGLLGSKNRIIEWMASGLPVAYNRHGDLGDILDREQLAFVFDIGDSDTLTSILVDAADSSETVDEIKKRALAYALNEFSFDATTTPLQDWCSRPKRSPDRSHGQHVEGPVARRSLKQELSAVAEHTPFGRSEVARRLWQRVKKVRTQRGQAS